MNNLRINARIWLETTTDSTTERFMGIGRMELLQHIQRTGSINQAAKAMRMSYKRAWELVHSVNPLADTPLVETQTGGEKGRYKFAQPALHHLHCWPERGRLLLRQRCADNAGQNEINTP